MSHELRSRKKSVFLVGDLTHQITGCKLPSNRQVLAVLFFNIREVKLTVSESANLVVRECMIFWEKARIPTRALPNCTKKLIDLYAVWRNIQKNANKTQDIFKRREEEFQNNLDNLFDIAHANALQTIKIEEDRIFLQRQREPGRNGYLAGVDKKHAEKEERARQKKIEEKKRQTKHQITASTSSASYDFSSSAETDEACSTSDETNDGELLSTLPEDTPRQNVTKRGTKHFITPKLVAALDRCQLSVRDAVYVLQATAEALGHSVDELPINRSSIQRIREKKRKERAEAIKSAFNDDIPAFVTIHWDGKLLPALNVRDSKEERLPIVVTFGDSEQLIAVPKLPNSSGKEQAQAVWSALKDWGLEDKVQVLCSDTTYSNTGRFNGACVLIEQKLDRELFFFPCRHHIYELVLRSVFETKIHQVTSSPDIPLFKQFRESWKNMKPTNFQSGKKVVEGFFNEFEINEMLEFYKAKLQEQILRSDYNELVELCVIFLGGDMEKKLKIRPPGAMHQARWMARAIYSLKMFLLRSQLKLCDKQKEALKDICLFIVTVYVKPWLQCSAAVKAPYQDLCFLQSLISYERVDATVSRAALKIFCQHLWYLSEDVSVLSLFDDEVDGQTKIKMVANLERENQHMERRYVPSCGEMTDKLLEKNMADFVSTKSRDLLCRLQLNTGFLQECPSTWENNISFLDAKRTVNTLKAVNDSAERAVKLMQDFHGLLTVDEEQKQFVLRCVQDHRKLYPNCKKETLKRKYSQ